MLRNYAMPNGHTYQYEDGKAPAEAVLVKTEEKTEEKTETKAKKPANKARKVADK